MNQNPDQSVFPYPVIDAHTHIFDDDICGGRTPYLPQDIWFNDLYANPKALLVTAETMIASMDVAGVHRSIACGFPWRDPGLCRAHNDYLATVAARFPDRLSWIATVAPIDPSAASEADRCLSLGAVGIGELNADAQGFDFGEPEQLGALVEVCHVHDRPILFHVSEPVGHSYPGKGTATPDRFVRFLNAYPDLSVVAAHWGGGLPFYELMPEIRAATSRVVYDSAASTYLYDFRVFRSVIDIVGADRVLMGSDYPVLRQDRFVRRAESAGLTTDEKGPILGGNAARVYRLPELKEQG